MNEVIVAYQGDLQCEASFSKVSVRTEVSLDPAVKVDTFGPTDLLSAALGSCTLTMMGAYAKNMNISLNGMKAVVYKEMAPKPEHRIAKFHLEITAPGSTLSDAQKHKLEEAARGCPVGNSLSSEIERTLEIKWT